MTQTAPPTAATLSQRVHAAGGPFDTPSTTSHAYQINPTKTTAFNRYAKTTVDESGGLSMAYLYVRSKDARKASVSCGVPIVILLLSLHLWRVDGVVRDP